MSRNFSFYIIVLLIFGGLIWLLLEKGKTLPIAANKVTTETVINVSPNVSANTINKVTPTDNTFISPSVNFFTDKIGHPICILLLQIIIIIIFARAFGFITGKLGQPVVIGEIIAGIVIGPSLLGHYFPATFAFVFPAGGMKYLEILSQVGLILFMFIIGMELDPKVIKLRVRSSLVISHTSILFAFFLGVLLAYFLYSSFAPAGTPFLGFALFIGIAMSIAAFPVLARIIQERGLTTTAFGKHIITIAAIDDLTAWCILAAIIAFIQAGNPMNALLTILLAAVYIVFMIFAIQPMMKKIGEVFITKEILNKKIIGFVFVVLFMSAFFTEIIGIKALFGAFLAGVIMPQHATFKKIMAEKIEDLALVVLLPLFFVLTGLRTEIGLMNQSDMWAVCGLIILFAIIGKFGGSFIAARITGMGWKDSLFVGTLMNTRGLMELIVLNIGYDLGVISSVVFTMMVIMTLVTTFMTGPTLNLIDYVSKRKERVKERPELRHLRILISFGLPKMGESLLKLVHAFSAKEKNLFYYTAVHLTPHTEITRSVAMKYEDISFAPIKAFARELDIRLKTLYKTTEDVTKEILRTTHKEKADFLLMGAAKSAFSENVLGGRVKNIIEQAKCNVGVFIDKDVKTISNVLILSDNYSVNSLLDISHRLLRNSDCNVTFVPDTNDKDTLKKIDSASFSTNSNIRFSEPMMPTVKYMNDFDLIIINIKHFEKYYDDKSDIINAKPSLLLINFTVQDSKEQRRLNIASEK
jgi:Kef-type K+ transport system membrane component KefB